MGHEGHQRKKQSWRSVTLECLAIILAGAAIYGALYGLGVAWVRYVVGT